MDHSHENAQTKSQLLDSKETQNKAIISVIICILTLVKFILILTDY